MIEDAPSDRYLVGRLAPRLQELEPEKNDNLPLGGKDTGDDGKAELGAPASKTLVPSSFGMSFSVTREAKDLRIQAEWGQY